MDIYRLLITLLLLVSSAPASTENPAFRAQRREVVTPLARLAFPDGITFSEITVPQQRSLLFPVPGEMGNEGGLLTLRYHCMGEMPAGAVLGVTLNEEVELRQPLLSGCREGEWRIPLSRDQLAGGQLKLRLQPHWMHQQGEPAPRAAVPASLRISALSSLTSYHTGAPRSLRDAWLMLPEQVLLSIPRGELTPQEFVTVLEWVRLLQRHHHQVQVVELPQLGELVVAPRKELARLPGIAGNLFWSQAESNLGIVTLGQRTVVVATSPFVSPWGDDLGWLSRESELLYRNGVAPPPLAATRVTLASLGLSSDSTLLGERAEWFAYITPWHLPAGLRPQRAVIEVALSRTRAATRVRFFVYLDDRMVMSRLLVMEGERQRFTVPLHAIPMNGNHLLRIVAVRLPTAQGEGERVSLAIDGRSHLELVVAEEREEGLSALPTRFGRGINLYLPPHYLTEAARYLPSLGRVLNGFVVAQGRYRLQVGEKPLAQTQAQDFIASAELLPTGEVLPLRLDRGEVEMVGREGRRLIDDALVRSSTLLQLKWHGKSAGLWITPGSNELPPLDAHRLAGEDVAIYGENGLLLSYNSRYKEMAHPRYRDYSHWYGYFVARRYQVLLAIWLLSALALFYLYRQSKYHHSR